MKKFIKGKAPHFFLLFKLILALIFIVGCKSRNELLFRRAQERVSEGHYLEAVDFYENFILNEEENTKRTKALIEIARLLRFEIKDYQKALSVYRKIVLESEEPAVRLQAQQDLAEVYFENLQDYTMALNELLILEPRVADKKTKELIRLRISQTYRFIGNFIAAKEYIDTSLKQAIFYKPAFLKLNAEIYLAEQKYDEAIKTYSDILKEDPDYFKTENMYFAIINAYEEKTDYKQAIAYLMAEEKNIINKELFELKVKKLKEKAENKPFSKGVRK